MIETETADSRTNTATSAVKQIINSAVFSTYAVRFDIDDKGESFYDLESFIDALILELPNFAYGGKLWMNVQPPNPIELVSEAAKAVFRIPEFKRVYEMYMKNEFITDDIVDDNLRKGEFGELILFFLLKNFHNTIPLLSKIYFKDSDNAPVHGFDAVQYHEAKKTLWLGESKIYENPRKGIESLIEDVKKHVTGDYLKREFVLISKKFKLVEITENMTHQKRDAILDMLSSQKSLAEKISYINLPLLCTFSASTFSKYKEETGDFLDAYKKEMEALKSFFEKKNDHPLKDRLNIILLLMPVKSKRDVVRMLLQRLYHAQSLLT